MSPTGGLARLREEYEEKLRNLRNCCPHCKVEFVRDRDGFREYVCRDCEQEFRSRLSFSLPDLCSLQEALSNGEDLDGVQETSLYNTIGELVLWFGEVEGPLTVYSLRPLSIMEALFLFRMSFWDKLHEWLIESRVLSTHRDFWVDRLPRSLNMDLVPTWFPDHLKAVMQKLRSCIYVDFQDMQDFITEAEKKRSRPGGEEKRTSLNS